MKYVNINFLTPSVKEILVELFGVYNLELFKTLKSRYDGIFYESNEIISFQRKGKTNKYPNIPFKIDIDEILDFILEENIVLTEEEKTLITEITN